VKTELPKEMKTLIASLPTPPSIKQEPDNEDVLTEKDELTLAAEVALESAMRSMKKRMNKSKASTKPSKKSKKSLRDDSESEYEPEEGDDDDDDDDDDDSVIFVDEVKPPASKSTKKKKKKTAKLENGGGDDDDDDDDSKSVVTISSVENLSQGSQGEPAGEDDVDLSDSLLHRTHWHRIVLDEAHKIKARTSNTAKCIYALKSTFKWCLTGTPLQNRIGDLYSLVRFLRMDPYAYYFCSTKNCDCKTLSWNFGPEARFCTGCGCGAPRHYSHFNRAVMNPINRYGYVGEGKKAMLTLRNDILLPAQLRRTKAERAERRQASRTENHHSGK
jgi:DNA repair protein RAD16